MLGHHLLVYSEADRGLSVPGIQTSQKIRQRSDMADIPKSNGVNYIRPAQHAHGTRKKNPNKIELAIITSEVFSLYTHELNIAILTCNLSY